MVKTLMTWIPVMAAMAGCAAAAAPPLRPVLRPARPALTGCVGDGNRIRIEAAATDAPVVVLTESRIGLGWQAELAMWADGSVIFDPVSGEDSGEDTTLETRVPAAAVEALRARVYDQLAGAPRQVERGRVDIGQGSAYRRFAHGPRTEIIVRGPDGWRVAFVAGVDRDDVLATDADRRREAELVRAEAEAFMADRARAIARGDADALEVSLVDSRAVVPDPVPAWFVDVYRTLLAAIPTTGAPLVPHGFRLRLNTDRPPRRVDPAARARSHPTRRPWPDDLAVPPPTLDPRLCDGMHEGDDCYFEIAPAQVAAARRHAGWRGRFVFAGQDWNPDFWPWYRGQSVIESVRECVGRLERVREDALP